MRCLTTVAPHASAILALASDEPSSMQTTLSTWRRARITTEPMVSSSLYMGMPATTKGLVEGSVSVMVVTNKTRFSLLYRCVRFFIQSFLK